MAFIGNSNTTQGFTPAIDYFNGNGSTTAFTLSRPVASVAQVQVVIGNVPQNPGSAYTVSGNTITFTSAPPSGTSNIYVYYTSPITQVVALPQSPQVFGNLQFSSLGARITGDFSNTTQSNRVMFQSSTTNGNSSVEVIPNGSATVSTLITNNNSDPLNGSIGYIQTQSAEFRVEITKRGTGTYLPMLFYTGGSERARIDTSGNFLFNSGYGSVATAYGCRAWVNFNGTGAVAIRASGNVSSITDNNVGSYTVNFTTTLADADYSVSGIPRNTQTYAAIQVLAIGISQATAPTTSALAIVVTGQNDGAVRSAVDSDYVCLAIFR